MIKFVSFCRREKISICKQLTITKSLFTRWTRCAILICVLLYAIFKVRIYTNANWLLSVDAKVTIGEFIENFLFILVKEFNIKLQLWYLLCSNFLSCTYFGQLNTMIQLTNAIFLIGVLCTIALSLPLDNTGSSQESTSILRVISKDDKCLLPLDMLRAWNI